MSSFQELYTKEARKQGQHVPNMSHAQFVQYMRNLTDDEAAIALKWYDEFRFNSNMDPDYKALYEIRGKRSPYKEKNRIRARIRKRFEREGKVSPNDGTHIHHLDGNVFNERDDNLVVVKQKDHKCYHNPTAPKCKNLSFEESCCVS